MSNVWTYQDRLSRGLCPLHNLPLHQFMEPEEEDGIVYVPVACSCHLWGWYIPEFGLFEIAAPFGNLIAAGRA